MTQKLLRRAGPGTALLLALGLLLAACGDTTAGATLSLTTITAASSVIAASPAAELSTLTATAQPAAPATDTALTATPAIFNTPPPAQTARTVPPTSTVPAATATPKATATPRPQIPGATGFPGKLSVSGPEKALYLLHFDGKGPQLVLGTAGVQADKTHDGAIYDWPTWSSDGSRLAVMSFNVKAGSLAGSDITVLDADGKNPVKVQENSPASPIFMTWSPDGRLLSLLVSGSSQLELRLLDTAPGLKAAAATSHKIAEGNAIYTGWSPDSQQIIIHASTPQNNALSLLNARDAKAQPVPLKTNPADFRSPAFSSDGALYAFAVENTAAAREEITLNDKNGKAVGTLDPGGTGVALNWSPAGPNRLAFTTALQDGQGFYRGISLYEASAATTTTLSASQIVNEPVIAFFWSPDGQKLAYAGFNDDGTMLQWKIYDTGTKKISALAEWYPSDSWKQMMQYFDQYAQAYSIWSPDSQALVFGGFTSDELAALKNQSVSETDLVPAVYVMPVVGSSAGKPLAVAAGGLAFWSK